MSEAIALPAELKQFAGRIMDVDTHEMMPLQEWVTHFGEDVRPLVEAWERNGETAATDKNHPNVPEYRGDSHQISKDIGDFKGCLAPGAVLPERRTEVMDAMGVRRQLMFYGGVGMYGSMLLAHENDDGFMPAITEDRGSLARRCVSLYQDWVIDTASRTDRIRPVAPVLADSIEGLIANTRHLIENGIRAIVLPAGLPVAGYSPAHSVLDPFWAMLAEADCAVTLHIGGQGLFFRSRAWGDAEPFRGFMALGEFAVDPWALSAVHLPFQNFLATMVTGGVFVRHPKLRFGVMEVGAYWLGPLMELLDLWHVNLGFFNTNPHKLPELPSVYIKRNVRVSVFPFEPVDQYIDRYGLEDVLAFSTDYPHVEGGKDIFRVMYDKLERLGPRVMEKFFVDNGKWMMAD